MINEEIQQLGGIAVLPNRVVDKLDYHVDIFQEDERDTSWLVLLFYPADFTWVCPTELRDVKNKWTAFEKLNTAVWAISTDGIEVHQKWIEEEFGSLPYPLMSDRNWDLSSDFGCLDGTSGMAYRCTVIIDPRGFIRHYSVSDNNVGRNIDEILRVLGAFQESDASDGQVAQCGWQPGDTMITPGE